MGIIDTLVAVAEENGAEILMETRAIEIVMHGRQGRRCRRRARATTEYTISAKAVMLASGGFDGQDWSKQLYAPGAVGWHTFSSPDNTGDGIELAKQAGAMIAAQGRPLPDPPGGQASRSCSTTRTRSLRMVPTGVFVTDLAYRCANESMTSQFDYFTPFVQSGRKQFSIICDSQQPEDRMDAHGGVRRARAS